MALHTPQPTDPRSAVGWVCRGLLLSPLLAFLALILFRLSPQTAVAENVAAPQTDSGVRVLTAHRGEVFAVAYSPDGQMVASGGADRVIHLWEPTTGRLLRDFQGHLGAVRGLAFSPDGRLLLSGSADGSARFWDVSAARELRAVSVNFGAVRAVAFSPDGRVAAIGGDDGTLRLLDVGNGKELRSLRGTFGVIGATTFSPDGRQVVIGCSDGTVRLIDVATGLQRLSLSGQSGAVQAVAYAPNGRWLVSGGQGGELVLWDVDARREHLRMAGHQGDVAGVRFSTDGRTLVSGGADGTVRVWDVASGQQRYALEGHQGPVGALALSPDAAQVASGGRDKLVRLQSSVPAVLSATRAEKIRQRGDEIGPVPSLPPLPEAEVTLSPLEARAGSSVTVTVSVANKGKGPLYRLQASIKSADTLFDGHLFYFGKVDPGRTATDSITLQLPRERTDGEVPLEVRFEEYHGFAPSVARAVVTIAGLPRPRFAYTYQILDDGSGQSVGNGDGRIQVGEAVDVLVTVKNVGTVSAEDAAVELSTGGTSGRKTMVSKLSIGPLQPDQAKSGRANLQVPRDYKDGHFPLQLFIRDRVTNVFLDEAIPLPIDLKGAPSVTALNKLVAVKDSSATIHSGAGDDTPALASASKGQSLAVTGQIGEWYRVQLSDSERGWVARQSVVDLREPVKGEMPVPPVTGVPVVKLFQKAPPLIAIASPSDGSQVSVDRVTLVGAAASERGIARVDILVNGRSLTQRETRGIKVVPTELPNAATMDFSERIPLQDGQNVIVVTAIDRDSQRTTRTLTVTRLSDRGKIWAVVVGISKYQAVQSLRFADRDATAFHAYLRSQVGVPADHVTLLLNEQATLTNLKRTLGTELKRKAGEKDTVIIYYAGHGAPEAEASASDEDGLEKYVVPYDADPKDLYTTALPMREVETIFHRLAAERVIFINDSCYSGATAGRTFATASRRAVVSDSFLNRLSSGRGRVVLTASKASEVSEEREDLGHGVFTYYLLEGLRGKADADGDGIITVDEAYTYVSKQVAEATGQNQHPVKKGEVEGQLVLGQVR